MGRRLVPGPVDIRVNDRRGQQKYDDREEEDCVSYLSEHDAFTPLTNDEAVADPTWPRRTQAG